MGWGGGLHAQRARRRSTPCYAPAMAASCLLRSVSRASSEVVVMSLGGPERSTSAVQRVRLLSGPLRTSRERAATLITYTPAPQGAGGAGRSLTARRRPANLDPSARDGNTKRRQSVMFCVSDEVNASFVLRVKLPRM